VGALVSVELGVGLGLLEALGEGLAVALGDGCGELDGCGLAVDWQLGDTDGPGLALGPQVVDGDEWCTPDAGPDVACDGEGDGEAAECPPEPGCPLCWFEFELLGDTAVETSIAT
jgi:hypothetical protein